jgi:hypothetical protein
MEPIVAGLCFRSLLRVLCRDRLDREGVLQLNVAHTHAPPFSMIWFDGHFRGLGRIGRRHPV